MTGIQSPTGSELIAAQPLLKEVKPAGNVHCFHCGTACEAGVFAKENRAFCCAGCLTVFELLSENGLTDFYSLDQQAGVPIQKLHTADRFSFLDEPSVRERIVNFSDADTTRVTFRLPAIHCIACVWLLENLFRLKPGIGQTRVDFLRKEASITFDFRRIQLSEVVALLASLGYEPDLNFSDLNSEAATKPSSPPRKLWIQLGVAGFAFGNNMLFSIAIYLGLDSFHGPAVQTLVGYISIVLAIPVLLYSAQDYFRLAWTGLKNRLLTIEVPIALGIMVIFAQSVYEVLSGRGEGYFDSFAGLLFFLLCGRLFQQKTYSRLAFDRDFRSFFPLSVIRLEQDRERPVSLSALLIGDRVRIRNGELIPADSRLLEGDAFIDYSFVTGEAEPVDKKKGDIIYAGGRQIGGTIEVLITKPVSQSYLTSLWNQEAFTKKTTVSLDTLINRYSQVFTISIIALAVGTAVYWSLERPELSLKALTSILIVACPCALALAAPFTLGTAIRVLGRQNIFVKNPHVLERLAQVDSLVFDKTGTLTSPGAGSIKFEGSPLSRTEACWIHSVACHSTHPYAARITGVTSREQEPENVRTFREIPGCGIEGIVAGHELALGSADWLRTRGVTLAETTVPGGGVVHVAVDHVYRGFFVLISAPRRDIEAMISKISTHKLALLSGDNERERKTFASLFGPSAELRFNQSPTTKLEYIRSLQSSGYKVMMIGDGLNDAGALKQSNVGVAVVESIGAFSPASDVIMSASVVPQIPNILQFSKGAVRIVRLSFFISTLYNVVGLTIAAQGLLAPIVCAILMPLSSISVVTFACLATSWWGRRVGLSNSSKGSER